MIGAVLCLAALPAAAQRTVFNPSLSLEQSHTDNAWYEADDPRSDEALRLTVSLPVVRDWKTGSLSFVYRPSFERYDQFSELDNDSHWVNLDLESSPSRGKTLSVRTRYSKSQTQGQAESLYEEDSFLTSIDTREVVRADLTYDAPLGGRWTWNGSLGASDSRFEEIPEAGTGSAQDRAEYRAGIRFEAERSRTASLGFRYGVQRFDLDATGEETVHSLSFTGRKKLERELALRFSVGGFSRRSEGDAGGGSDDTSSGLEASLSLDRTFRRAALGLSLSHRPSAGGTLPGTSTNSTAGLNAHGDVAGLWFWSGSARYARRDPTGGGETIDNRSLGGRIERGFLRVLGLSLDVNVSKQKGGNDPSVFTAALGLVYHPLGRTELAR